MCLYTARGGRAARVVSVFVDDTRREGCQGGECLYTARGGKAVRVVSVCTLHEEGGLPGW